VKLPEKDYLRFDELAKKWKCSLRDLSDLIINRKIIPSVLLIGRHSVHLVEPHEDEDGEGLYVSGAADSYKYVNGFFYLQWVRRENLNRISSAYAFEKREMAEFDDVYSFDAVEIWFDPEENEITSSTDVVIVREEIERFEREHLQASEDSNQEIKQVTYPWGTHSTKLLTQLSEAAIKHWGLYDPTQPDTAPKNDEVSDWLINKGVSKTLADAMATILRADGLRTGRR